MGARKLAGRVAVRDKDLNTHWFGPDDDVPEWASTQITSDFAWAQDERATELRAADVVQHSTDDDAPERPVRRTTRRRQA